MEGSELVTTQKRADTWETAMPLLSAMFIEVKELAKKKPEAVVSKAKILVINRLINACREILDGQPSLGFLDVLNEDDVPQMSDVALALSQYMAAMEQFRSMHYGYDRGSGERRWRTKK